uniref:Cobw domain-containing protein 2-like n=1 Tax=Tetraselmis sp. GSL018 TaxID=582737 RepID=A0A061RRA9_9CHLO
MSLMSAARANTAQQLRSNSKRNDVRLSGPACLRYPGLRNYYRRQGHSKIGNVLVRGRLLRMATVKASAESASEGASAPTVVEDKRIPITVITGFLGSGKTTTLNNILTKDHGRRIAIIENEFGEIDIDSKLVSFRENSTEKIMMLNNGCLCCTVRGDLVNMIFKLYEEHYQEFDHVVVETTGLANPAPIIYTFTDQDISQLVRLDGVVTVVDAKHITRHLDAGDKDDSPNEALEQLAYADRIILNKTDLVTEPELEVLESRIRKINSMATIRRVQHGDIDVDYVLGIGGFDSLILTALRGPSGRWRRGKRGTATTTSTPTSTAMMGTATNTTTQAAITTTDTVCMSTVMDTATGYTTTPSGLSALCTTGTSTCSRSTTGSGRWWSFVGRTSTG